MKEKVELRIVAGSIRGRKLACIVHPGLRPTPQLVREAVFSILGNAVPGRLFYDLFAGSGVFGLEAVSRGASGARLIEKDARQAVDIQKHADKFGIADRVQVLRADVYRWAERWVPPMVVGKDKPAPVNLFLSPPFPHLDPEPLHEFLTLVRLLWEKAPDESVLTIQAEDGFPTAELPDHERWDVRKYGRNLLLIRVKGDDVDPPAAGGENTDVPIAEGE